LLIGKTDSSGRQLGDYARQYIIKDIHPRCYQCAAIGTREHMSSNILMFEQIPVGGGFAAPSELSG